MCVYFFHHFLSADDVVWLAQFKDSHLSSDEARALVVVREAGAIDNAGYRALNKVDTLVASQAEDAANAARSALLNELPGELAARVGAMGKRQIPEAVRAIVVELCSHRAWRAEELALLLTRKAETVRQDYLRPLMRDGLVRMTKPDTPNDPQQSYQASRR